MNVAVSLQSKACTKCGEVKTLDGFSKRKASKDGCQSECKACVKKYDAEYRAANPEKFRAKDAKRRAAKLLAIPSWLTEKDYKAMEAIYAEAKRLEAETGLIYHVDHIHPLQGKLVCGFHCPSNLQILTEAENCSKNNRFTPYVESDLIS